MPNPPVRLGEYGQAFASNLRTIRKLKDVTIDDLSARLKLMGHRLTPDQITRIEAGQRRADTDDICNIAHALGVRVNRICAPSHLQLMPNRPLSGHMADHGRRPHAG